MKGSHQRLLQFRIIAGIPALTVQQAVIRRDQHQRVLVHCLAERPHTVIDIAHHIPHGHHALIVHGMVRLAPVGIDIAPAWRAAQGGGSIKHLVQRLNAIRAKAGHDMRRYVARSVQPLADVTIGAVLIDHTHIAPHGLTRPGIQIDKHIHHAVDLIKIHRPAQPSVLAGRIAAFNAGGRGYGGGGKYRRHLPRNVRGQKAVLGQMICNRGHAKPVKEHDHDIFILLATQQRVHIGMRWMRAGRAEMPQHGGCDVQPAVTVIGQHRLIHA